MTTNVQGTRLNSRPGEQPTGVEPTPVITPLGTGGVAVYDVDSTTNPTLHPSASMVEDRAPVEVRSTGSILTWIISAIVLIVLAYFILQMLF